MNTGTYYDIFETDNGDSIVIVDLLITTELDVAVEAVDDFTIMANIPDAEYQWLDCNNNSMAIPGANSQDFTPTETGDYAVQITKDDCTSISDCYNIILTGIDNIEFASSFNIYPNPTKNNVVVNFNQVHKELKITLRNVLGQIIFIENINNVSGYHFDMKEPTGLYFLEIETKNGQSAIFKILKN
jgi:hypothetical protein